MPLGEPHMSLTSVESPPRQESPKAESVAIAMDIMDAVEPEENQNNNGNCS